MGRPQRRDLSAALPTTLASQVDALRALSRRHAVAVGGAGAAANRSEWLASRTLPADPIIAAHPLPPHQALAPRSTAENRQAPVTCPLARPRRTRRSHDTSRTLARRPRPPL